VSADAAQAAAVRTAVLLTHSDPAGMGDALRSAQTAAERASCSLVAAADEVANHGDAAGAIQVVDELPARPDLCLVLGGDGTILRALRNYAWTGVPVFAVNLGTIGFLSAVEGDQLDAGLERAFAGDFEVLSLPALEIEDGGKRALGLNDITFARRPRAPVAELAYRLAGEEIGHVRCDGLVAATPAGSTGYNLANSGPILAWGVEGYAVSFIAPHTLTARALVVAPDDVLHVRNEASRGPVEVAFDGSHERDLEVGEEVEVRFRHGVGSLAQLPGANFYHRMNEKFGRLAGGR
jgi:NAD+ kinase